MTNLLWVDLEMTGLDVRKERIIEVACIVTDLQFHELGSYEAIVKQDQTFLDNMDEWNKRTHGESGLASQVPLGKRPSEVETELINIVTQFFKKTDKPILAGNSISQDRLFIDEYMKSFASLLHYRMLDVSSWKIIMSNRFNINYKKSNSHRALDDIRESIAELKHYLQFIKI